MKDGNTKLKVIAIALAAALGILLLSLLFLGGSIEYSFEDTSLTIHTALWKDVSVRYDEIDDVCLRDDIQTGERTNGYGSGKLNLGEFRMGNSETICCMPIPAAVPWSACI